MNASEARKITNGVEIDEKEAPKILNLIYKKVEDAANKGQNSISWVFYKNTSCFDNIKKACIKQFEKDGYEYREIKNPDPGNPCSCSYDILSW